MKELHGDRRSGGLVILGIDPGLRITGYGLVSTREPVALLEAGIIEGGAERLPLPERLRNLHQGLETLIAESNPDAMAMEQLYSHYAHPRTAILMGHARGVLCLAAAAAGVPVFDYAATEVKSSLTGNGRATKQQVQRAIRSSLNLAADPHPADVADALAVALCHTHRMRRN